MSNDSGMTMEWLAPVVTGVIGLAGIAGTYKAAAAQRKFQIDAIRLQQQYDWAKIEVAKREAAYLEYMVALKGTVVAIMGRAKAKGHYKFTDPLDKQTCEKMLIAARRPREEAWERLRAQVDRPVVDAAWNLVKWISEMERYVRDDKDLKSSWDELWNEYEARRDALESVARKSHRIEVLLLQGMALGGHLQDVTEASRT